MSARPKSYGELIAVLDNLGPAVHEARRARRHSMRAAASAAGLAVATIHRAEAGLGIELDTAIALLKYLDPATPDVPPTPPQTETLPLEGDTDDGLP